MKPRRLLVALMMGAVALMLLPAGATAAKKKHPPRVDFAVAAYEEVTGVVKLAVNVHGAESVEISFEGDRQDASHDVESGTWWNAQFPGGLRQCYRIEVHAANGDGRVKRAIGAGLLGTPGCTSCDDQERALGRAHQKVKRARAHLRNADSAEERRHARHRLRRTKQRLDRAEQSLERCLAQRRGA